MNRKLLLWDIDGTLIWSGGAGERAMERATKNTMGIDLDLHTIDYSGRTDKHIARMILEHFGRPVTPEAVHDFAEAYLIFLAEELPLRKGKVHPGILAILERVRQRKDLAQGLLTGNLERGAQVKLRHFDVWHYFEFGAYAEDGAERNELGPHAIRKAAELFSAEFPPENVFVIGDTPHDIECGKGIGAKTIAAATGKFNAEELLAHNPTAVLTDFADVDGFFTLIDGSAVKM